MAKYRVWISTNKIGSKCERIVTVSNEDIAFGYTEDCEEFGEDMLTKALSMAEWGWERIE